MTRDNLYEVIESFFQNLTCGSSNSHMRVPPSTAGDVSVAPTGPVSGSLVVVHLSLISQPERRQKWHESKDGDTPDRLEAGAERKVAKQFGVRGDKRQ
jgi:hypothetical protein